MSKKYKFYEKGGACFVSFVVGTSETLALAGAVAKRFHCISILFFNLCNARPQR